MADDCLMADTACPRCHTLQLANRMAFDVHGAGDASFVGEDMGMLGSGGGGKLRLAVKDSGLAAKAAKKMAVKERRFGSSGGTNGMASSVAFTPVQVGVDGGGGGRGGKLAGQPCTAGRSSPPPLPLQPRFHS